LSTGEGWGVKLQRENAKLQEAIALLTREAELRDAAILELQHRIDKLEDRERAHGNG
jgi:hypothetical protein